jgi:hypothetical protein
MCFAPENGVKLEWLIGDSFEMVFFRRCVDNAACRVAEGYQCDPYHRACLPATPVYLTLAPNYSPSGFCADDLASR